MSTATKRRLNFVLVVDNFFRLFARFEAFYLNVEGRRPVRARALVERAIELALERALAREVFIRANKASESKTCLFFGFDQNLV